MYVIDRIIDGIVVLESLEDKSKIEVDSKTIIGVIKDGQVVKFDGQHYIVDEIETFNRRRNVQNRWERLKMGVRNVKLVLVRHGESLWNLENRFTGWVDIDLSDKGIEEAINAGKLLKEKNIIFNKVYTSKLKRSINTFKYMDESLNTCVNHNEYEELNERYYGSLQGLNKDDARREFGEEQVQIWRRSYDVRPPEGESLKDTLERVKKVYDSNIRIDLLNHENVLVVAHGNSLRALIKLLENISDEDIVKLEIPTGKPIIYTLDGDLNIIEKEM